MVVEPKASDRTNHLYQKNQSYLLPGEVPESTDPEDARQWLTVYRELVSFARRTMDRLTETPKSADQSAVAAHLHRLETRLAYWEHRFWQLAGLNFDMRARTVRYRASHIKLTRREAQLLVFLAQRPNEYFSAEQLVTEAWAAPNLSEEQLRTYVVRLRQRLAEAQVPLQLLTVPRRGYRLEFLEAIRTTVG